MPEGVLPSIENPEVDSSRMVQNQKNDGKAAAMFSILLRRRKTRAGKKKTEDSNASTKKMLGYPNVQRPPI